MVAKEEQQENWLDMILWQFNRWIFHAHQSIVPFLLSFSLSLCFKRVFFALLCLFLVYLVNRPSTARLFNRLNDHYLPGFFIILHACLWSFRHLSIFSSSLSLAACRQHNLQNDQVKPIAQWAATQCTAHREICITWDFSTQTNYAMCVQLCVCVYCGIHDRYASWSPETDKRLAWIAYGLRRRPKDLRCTWYALWLIRVSPTNAKSISGTIENPFFTVFCYCLLLLWLLSRKLLFLGLLVGKLQLSFDF